VASDQLRPPIRLIAANLCVDGHAAIDSSTDVKSSAMEHSISDAATVVLRWLAAVFDDRDLAAAWPLTDRPFRLAIAQSWIMLEADRSDLSSIDRDELASRLAIAEQPSESLWAEFAGWRLVRWREVLPDYVTAAELRGAMSGEYLTAPEIEQVWIAHIETKVIEGSPIEAQRFLVRHIGNEWKVAGIGGVLPIPGWPPTETPRF
jgi:hypothetical protein